MLLLVCPTEAQLRLSQDLHQPIGKLGTPSPPRPPTTFPSLLSATCHIFSDSQGSLFLFLWLEHCLVWFYFVCLFCFAFGVLATCVGQLCTIGVALGANKGPFSCSSDWSFSLKFAPCSNWRISQWSCLWSWLKGNRGGNNQETHPPRVTFPVWPFSFHLFAVVNFRTSQVVVCFWRLVQSIWLQSVRKINSTGFPSC